MAFIDFSDAALQALPTPLTQPAETLDAMERRIVALARGDGLASLKPHRKRGWFLRLILGPTPPSAMLANEQLEALRRLAVRAWHHGYTLPVSALKEARQAGYSEAKIGAVIDTIGRNRAPFRSIAA
ncbi:hypothetical protein [Novosphingobium guangzhouense]|uniref:Uncharacterized protein n=1 Tax=Novosphingobium guangzhouense TaxID=1850347 RepID=A0A2K2G6P6_9SPHN|nr:hypothetical protein [Novosphingobium guangzhouense]PNU06716.1 hypothetical protein A8V01_00555 [Novosphingobium guangzhouense]